MKSKELARGRFRKEALGVIFALLAMAGCNGDGMAYAAQSQDALDSQPAIGESCRSTDPTRICLAIKYVAYKDANGVPAVTEEAELANLKLLNSLYAQCNVAFQIDEVDTVNPSEKGLSYAPGSIDDMDSIRQAYGSDSMLTIITTGTWAGSLGAGSANAWTEMPGNGPYGAVIEKSVGNYSPIVAHEMGHYLGLEHVSDVNDLMNPVIYTYSTTLSAVQCATVRSSVHGSWQKMIRF